MRLNIPLTLIAADTESRTISGRVVTWGEEGNTSRGKTIFAAGSIQPKDVRLLLEHDRTRPIGRSLEMVATDKGIDAKFKIADTQAGTDSLIEAASGLRDGFSVGIDLLQYDMKGSTLVVEMGELVEISLVTDPAIDSARVDSVAASEEEENKASESSDSESTETTEGDEVDNTVKDEAASADTVEAAKSLTAQDAPRPAFFTAPRIDPSPLAYLSNSIKAAKGDLDAAYYLKAADSTDNAGLIPTPQGTTLINGISNSERGFIDACSRETLVSTGLSFELPKLTVAPTVATTAEGTAPSDTGMETEHLSVSIVKMAGQQTYSWELADRSSPEWLSALLTQMEFAYAKATDAYAKAQASSGAGAATSVPTDDAAGYFSYFANGAANVYTGSLGYARNLVASPGQWAKLMAMVDSADRPLFISSNPQNNGGALSSQSLRGNVAGLDFYVSRSLSGTGDGSMAIINPNAITFYESPRLRLTSNVIATGEITTSLYGYCAVGVKIAGGITFNDNV